MYAFVWSLIVLAFCLANLPFINQRLFALLRIKAFQKKPLWVRLIELVVIYFLLGILAHLLESNLGSVFSQGWEFFAITACLLIVFAFPGFIFQYLRRR